MSIQFTRRSAIFASSMFVLPSLASAQAQTQQIGDPLTVELTGVALPVVRDGVLVNYLFSVIVIQLGDGPSTFFLRENSYLLRDAVVRIASKSPIPAGSAPQSFDRVAVTRVLLRAIQAIRPSARVVRVTVQDPAFMRN